MITVLCFPRPSMGIQLRKHFKNNYPNTLTFSGMAFVTYFFYINLNFQELLLAVENSLSFSKFLEFHLLQRAGENISFPSLYIKHPGL
jgi:hypothetical protein